MRSPSRLLMDVSYTRTQRVSVGITRTVRRLEEELRRLQAANGASFAAVSFHSGGFRELGPGTFSCGGASPPATQQMAAARLFRWISGVFFRKLVLVALKLPWTLLRFIWAAASTASFDFLSRSERMVAFAPGDVLLLCDASWNYPVWTAARKARAQGAKVVLLVYDLIPIRHPEFCFQLVPHVFKLWLEKMLPLADAVVCISRATEAEVRSHAGETGTALPPMGHFRLGSDLVRTPLDGPVRDVLRRFLAAPPCFTAIGSFEPKKNYGFLVSAFERLWARGCSLRLLIIGRESAESAELVRSLRSHAEQGKRLLTLFDADDSEVDFAYAHCRALVFPSCAEGFGLPLVEARTRGSLVIASSLPAFVELADAGVHIYPEGSRESLEGLVLELAQDDGGERVPPMAPFTWGNSATQLVELFQNLLQPGRPA